LGEGVVEGSSILSDKNNHHGLGIHLGIINDSDVDVVFGTIGLGYTYFLTGYPLNKNNNESQNLKVLEMRLNECNQNN